MNIRFLFLIFSINSAYGSEIIRKTLINPVIQKHLIGQLRRNFSSTQINAYETPKQQSYNFSNEKNEEFKNEKYETNRINYLKLFKRGFQFTAATGFVYLLNQYKQSIELIKATKENNIQKVQDILSNSNSKILNNKDLKGKTALYYALVFGHNEISALLIEDLRIELHYKFANKNINLLDFTPTKSHDAVILALNNRVEKIINLFENQNEFHSNACDNRKHIISSIFKKNYIEPDLNHLLRTSVDNEDYELISLLSKLYGSEIETRVSHENLLIIKLLSNYKVHVNFYYWRYW